MSLEPHEGKRKTGLFVRAGKQGVEEGLTGLVRMVVQYGVPVIILVAVVALAGFGISRITIGGVELTQKNNDNAQNVAPVVNTVVPTPTVELGCPSRDNTFVMEQGYTYSDLVYGSGHWFHFGNTEISYGVGNYPYGREGSVGTYMTFNEWWKAHQFTNVPTGAFYLCLDKVSGVLYGSVGPLVK